MRRPVVLVLAPSGGDVPLRTALGRVAGIELAGLAHDVPDALEAIERESPDLVAIDSAFAADECAALFDALARRSARPAILIVGARADAYPVGRGSGALVIERLDRTVTGGRGASTSGPLAASPRDELARRLRALFARTAPGVPGGPDGPDGPADERRTRPAVRLLAVGVSTGGPEALTSLLGALPATFAVPVLVVQHMPAAFVPKLARRLDGASALSVDEARDGETLAPGTVRIAPGGASHLRVACRYGDLTTHLVEGPPENACRPAVDALFRSAAHALGTATLGLVMTGMGRDGYLGARALAQAGARVIVQDEPSSIVWGMPGHVARSGLASAVVPLDRLADDVLERVGHVGATRVRGVA